MRKANVVALLVACSACQQNASTAPAAKRSSAVASAAVVQPKGKYAPRDECAQLPGAADFRERLVEAVQLRDAGALAELADPAIKLDFGGGGGVAQLKQKLADPKLDLWRDLAQMLTLGCAADGHGGLIIPWLFSQNLGDIDPSAAVLVTGEDVPILSAPRASARPLVTLSWELVNAPGFDRSQAFQRISMPGKDDGYIATDKLRRVLDYRLLASREGRQWKITALVAGD